MYAIIKQLTILFNEILGGENNMHDRSLFINISFYLIVYLLKPNLKKLFPKAKYLSTKKCNQTKDHQ